LLHLDFAAAVGFQAAAPGAAQIEVPDVVGVPLEQLVELAGQEIALCLGVQLAGQRLVEDLLDLGGLRIALRRILGVEVVRIGALPAGRALDQEEGQGVLPQVMGIEIRILTLVGDRLHHAGLEGVFTDRAGEGLRADPGYRLLVHSFST